MQKLLACLLFGLGGLAAAEKGCAGQGCKAPDLPEDEVSALVQLRRLNASKGSDQGLEHGSDHVPCPGSGNMCTGNQCCPGSGLSGGKTFPCPTADPGFDGCETGTPGTRCPGSETMCAGNQCCPGSGVSGGKTFPCPTADPGFDKCEVKSLVNTGAQRLAEYLRDQRTPRRSISYEVCTLSATQSCPMSEMHGTTMVIPGGGTGCLEGEYAFLVSPGDTDKLVFQLQGGGACWDSFSYSVGTCTKSLDLALSSPGGLLDGAGVFNRSDPRNGLRAHTFVQVLYCSGDLHAGNAVQHWKPFYPKQVQVQAGYNNTLAAAGWTQANVQPELTSLVVSGDSAGALGAQVWSGLLLREKFKYQAAAVIPDSYVGFFPKGTICPTLQTFGSCELPVFTPAEQAECLDGTLTVPGFMTRTLAEFPGVPFGYLQSKEDVIQRIFYDSLYFTTYHFDPVIKGPAFYFNTNLIFQEYTKYTNLVEFYVDGDTHTFAGHPYYYTAGTLGASTGSAEGQPDMTPWVNVFLSRVCPSAYCHGPTETNNKNGTDYCDESLAEQACVKETAFP